MIVSLHNGRSLALAVLLTLSQVPQALAELAVPQGEVILSIDGAIAETNGSNGATFDMEMLQALPVTGFETTTTWTVGEQRFEGVTLKELLAIVGAKGTSITATALNNYSVQIPIEAIGENAPIVAYHIDGKPFSRRDKGPLWIVFPYDASPEYQTELVYGWSIWQLSSLTITD